MRLSNAISFVLAVGLGAAALVYAPAVLAWLCPRCYGLVEVRPGLYADPAMTLVQRAALQSEIDDARRRMTAFFGPVERVPVYLVCVTEACDRKLGAGDTAARAFGDRFIHVTRNGLSARVIAHEMAHVEVNARVGIWRHLTGDFPAWFNEGLAVVVSRDAQALRVGPMGRPRCRVEPRGALPVRRADWRRRSGAEGWRLYAEAGCAVLRWIEANGGRSLALRALDEAGWDGALISGP